MLRTVIAGPPSDLLMPEKRAIPGADARLKERFVCIEVSQTRNETLVEEHSLDCSGISASTLPLVNHAYILGAEVL
jgi:hypothetical protein